MHGGTAHAADSTEPRRQPMTFTWHGAKAGACGSDCRDWIAATGVITNETPALFEKVAAEHDLQNTTVVLDSSGGSVLDALALGRIWRAAGLHTTVGTVIERDDGHGRVRAINPDAYCESMCVFLLLGGATRDVPPEAHVRVHQIWMGDRATNAKAASYSAQDLMIVERDVGRLAKYTFEMGGTGELLALALSVPPWEPLHELNAVELRTANIVIEDAVAAKVAPASEAAKTVAVSGKAIQDRVAAEVMPPAPPTQIMKSTKTAEALPPTGGTAVATPEH
ncbi:MAG: hypothetical protein K2W78_13805 [Xanthobacteraceae bacterium]|nr:hypothetical protein [Xanthobacteraceae bacterium]